MKTRLKICMFSAVFVLLAGILLSQAYALDDDVRVVAKGKQIVQISPRPTIDSGEEGQDPNKAMPVRSMGMDATQDVQISRDSETWLRDRASRYEALRIFLLLRIGQLL
jgi:hypothetical protein